MKAAMLKALGQPLSIECIVEPVPGAGEVLVRVVVAPVLAYAHEVFSGVRDYPLLLPLVGSRIRPVLLTEDEAINRRQMAEAADGPIDCLLDILSPIRDPAPTRQGIMAVRPGGTAVLMGGVEAALDVPYKYIMRNNIVIRGQYMYPRHAPLQLAELIGAGLLNLEPFSVATFPLEEVNQAVQYAREHGGAFQLTVLKPASM